MKLNVRARLSAALVIAVLLELAVLFGGAYALRLMDPAAWYLYPVVIVVVFVLWLAIVIAFFHVEDAIEGKS